MHRCNLPEDLHKCEISACLDLSSLVAAVKFQILDLGLVVGCFARPFQSLGPALVSEP